MFIEDPLVFRNLIGQTRRWQVRTHKRAKALEYEMISPKVHVAWVSRMAGKQPYRRIS